MLPGPIMEFLNRAAQDARAPLPDSDSSLFTSGVLDSFSLVDFVTLIEGECGIKIDDGDLRPENFDTVSKVCAFIERAKARSA